MSIQLVSVAVWTVPYEAYEALNHSPGPASLQGRSVARTGAAVLCPFLLAFATDHRGDTFRSMFHVPDHQGDLVRAAPRTKLPGRRLPTPANATRSQVTRSLGTAMQAFCHRWRGWAATTLSVRGQRCADGLKRDQPGQSEE